MTDRLLEEVRAAIERLEAPPAPVGLIGRVVAERARGVRRPIPQGDVALPKPRVRRSVLAAAVLVLLIGIVVLPPWSADTEDRGYSQGRGDCDMSNEMPRLVVASAFFLSVACAQDITAPPPAVSPRSLVATSLRPSTWVYETGRWEDGIVRSVLSRQAVVLERVQLDDRQVWRSHGETRFAVPAMRVSLDTLWLDDALRPIRQVWHHETARRGKRKVMDLRYGTDGVVGVFQDMTGRIRGTVQITLPVEPVILPSYSRAGLAYVLKSVPMGARWAGSFQTVRNGRPPRAGTVSLAVMGEARITVPAGTFECWQLGVVGQPDSRIWVSKDEQILIMTSDGAQGYELETKLVSYQASD